MPSNILAKAFVGAFVGCVFGFFVEGVCFDHDTRVGVDKYLPVVGPAIGAVVFAFLVPFIADVPIEGWKKTISTGILVGLTVGSLVGAFVISPWLTSLEIAGDSPFWGKFEASHRRTGILMGATAGVIVGAGGALAIWTGRQVGRRDKNAAEVNLTPIESL